MAKKLKLTPNMIDTLGSLNTDPSVSETVAEMKARGVNTNPSVLRGLIDRGLVVSTPTEIEVVTVAKRTVNTYTVTDAGLEVIAGLDNVEDPA